jgi:flavin-dependent dehydrogenase
MDELVVVGGGVAGLGAALALARSGHPVTVLERDKGRLPDSPDHAFEQWDRHGAPQFWHSHGFLARLRNLLRDRAPDVLAALLEAGATELRFTDRLPVEMEDTAARPGDEELVALACRRVTFEWVLRRCVMAEPGVRFVDGTAVDGLVHDDLRVRGVRAGNVEFAAGHVVDASGRRSSLDRWLVDIGAGTPEEETVECGILYLSRFYRLLEGAEEPVMEGPIGGDLGYVKYAIFPGDNRTFSVTFGLNTDETTMRPLLLQPHLFDAAARSLPSTAAWVDSARAAPISDVKIMARLVNRARRFVIDGEPLALGVHAIGDAAVHTNPLYGRGCSLALVHAWLLADLVAAHTGDPHALALAFDTATRAELEPWYRASVAQDRQNQASAGGDEADGMRSLTRDGLMPAVRRDPEVFRAFLRVFNLLDPPDAMLKNSDVTGRILAVWQARGERPDPPPEGPSHDEMLAILART